MSNLIGTSEIIGRLNARLERLAALEANVLIEGETGTGKELAARSIHSKSARCKGPFVALNCGALPRSLLESQLFGSAKGTFTGASEDRRGLCEEANGGILFLDEIGELPLEAQAALLRFLDSGEIMRLGENRSRRCDVRVIAATNRKLQSMLEAGTFRQDLYYRLSVLKVAMPPLASHIEDIGQLARHFLCQIGSGYQLSDDAVEALRRRQWPGNVRELRNVMWQAAEMAENHRITANCIPVDYWNST
ncbi:MAG: sigma-54-dependent Fis family transcriptional regulator, partial [Victivallales bacterium]|nr:sigma-54-dependent Fis family transcriptional regulator [Victivallales bacterium]